MEERIELRCTGGPLLGILNIATVRLEVKRGHRLFEVDLRRTLAEGIPVIIERVLHAELSNKEEPVAHPAE